MTENDVYGQLAANIGFAGSRRFIRILQALMTPEEGKLLLEIPTWTTGEQLAKKLNTDEKSLSIKLDNLVRRGLVAAGKQGFACPPEVHQFQVRIVGSAEEYIPPAFYDLWKDFRFAEELPYFSVSWVKRYEERGIPIHRIIPARLALLASPNIQPEQVLWYEDVGEIVRRTEKVVLHDCGCRRISKTCDTPSWVHLQLSKASIESAASRGSRGREATHEEAIAAMDSAGKAGLVHIGMNIAGLMLICSCCNDCCIVIPTAVNYHKVHEIISPSRYRAAVNRELCAGCQTCVDVCYFSAIEMKKVANSKKLKASIINEECMGCGNCIINCPQKALTFELVRPPEHIPTVSAMQLMSGR